MFQSWINVFYKLFLWRMTQSGNIKAAKTWPETEIIAYLQPDGQCCSPGIHGNSVAYSKSF